METFLQDIRYGQRMLRKNPTFAVVVILTLALGIGANTAIFSVIRAVLLKPLPYPDSDRVVFITEGATPLRFEEMVTATHAYTGVGAFASGPEDMALSGIGEPEVLKAARVSTDFLQILRIRPLLGRGFVPAEDKPGAAPVAMISAGLWQRRFREDPSIVGKTITLAGAPRTIIGILPAGFQFPFSGDDVWVARPSEWSVIAPQYRGISPILSVFGRLRPNVTLEQASAELAVLHHQYGAAHPGMLDAKPDSPDRVRPLKSVLVSDVSTQLWTLFGAVGFVLLIVCANVGNLLLARATYRSRELAVRSAIGAGRARIIRQLLTESILLASIGGALGVALAASSLRAIRSVTSIDLPRAGEIRLDGAVLGFALLLCVATALMFGLLPSLAASRPDLAHVLRGSGELGCAKGEWRRRLGPRSLLVVGEVALSVVLLIAATLLVESLANVYRVDPGFQPAGVLTMSLTLSPTHYDTDQKRARFYEELVQHVESVPGVRNAVVTLTLPMADSWLGTTLQVSGRAPVKLNERPIGIFQKITPGYFRTMGIALKRGREFSSRDNLRSARVAIISEDLARLFWPRHAGRLDPIGQHLLIGSDPQPVEVVGVVADVHQTGSDLEPRPEVYVPCLQNPSQSVMLAVRTDGDPVSFANAVRSQVLAIDPDQPVSGLATMNDLVDASEGQLRLMMRLLGVFAGVATLVAVIGLYGVVSYSVAQRTREIGLRQALGASRNSILRLVVTQGLGLVLVGVILGACLALGLTRVLKSLLFHVRATDPATFISISAVFAIVALLATYVPARRAAKVDPMVALRYE